MHTSRASARRIVSCNFLPVLPIQHVPAPTFGVFRRPCKGKGGPVRGTAGPVRGAVGPVTGTGPLFIARSPFSIACVPFLGVPNLVVSNLAVCNFYVFALFCTLFCFFALFCALFAPLWRATAFRTTAFGNFRPSQFSLSQGRPPGLIQHVLTVLVSWSRVLLLPRLPPSSRSLRLFPWASILLYGPLNICCPQLRRPPMQKQDAQAHVFTAQGGTRRLLGFARILSKRHNL